MSGIEVRRVRDRAELDAALDLREAVFCGEQGVTLEGDRDGLDDAAVQLVAVDADGAVIGTCRVLVTPATSGAGHTPQAGRRSDPSVPSLARGRFGRLCVRRDRRGQGLAAALLAEAEREARAAGCASMGLAAQTDAMRLYEQAGYSVYSEEPFMDEGIEHVGMEKDL